MAPDTIDVSRRRFLQFVAGSPLFALAGGEALAVARMLQRAAQNPQSPAAQDPSLIQSAQAAINVFDFEPVAKAKLPPAHWGYLATGTDDDGTIRANREGYGRWELKMRRLVDVSRVDPGVEVLGTQWPTLLGYNQIVARTTSDVLATVGDDPLLVVSRADTGRTAAFASDIAPHWATPEFLAWAGYARLFDRLVRWLATEESA